MLNCTRERIAYRHGILDYDNEWDMDADAWHRRVGSAGEREIFAASELNHTGILEPFRLWIEAPEGVEVVLREKEGRRSSRCTLCDKIDAYQDKPAQTVQKCVRVKHQMNGAWCLC